jgi:hypothetical protein
MRSISRNYRKIQDRNPSLGTHPCLCQAVRHRKFSRKCIVKAFKELMPEEEYAKDETKELIDYLEYLTNLPEEGEFRGKNGSGTAK